MVGDVFMLKVDDQYKNSSGSGSSCLVDLYMGISSLRAYCTVAPDASFPPYPCRNDLGNVYFATLPEPEQCQEAYGNKGAQDDAISPLLAAYPLHQSVNAWYLCCRAGDPALYAR